jgi:hypothetical protein
MWRVWWGSECPFLRIFSSLWQTTGFWVIFPNLRQMFHINTCRWRLSRHKQECKCPSVLVNNLCWQCMVSLGNQENNTEFRWEGTVTVRKGALRQHLQKYWLNWSYSCRIMGSFTLYIEPLSPVKNGFTLLWAILCKGQIVCVKGNEGNIGYELLRCSVCWPTATNMATEPAGITKSS